MCNLTSKTDNFHYWPSFKRHEVYNNIFCHFYLEIVWAKRLRILVHSTARSGAQPSMPLAGPSYSNPTFSVYQRSGLVWNDSNIYNAKSTQNNEKNWISI